MQLGKLTKSLSTATCALLGATQASASEPWQVDSAVMVYSETDRVSTVEPSIYAKKTLDDDSIVSVYAVADSLTGASPNGATPSDQIQSFTSPSGQDGYRAEAGEKPLDDSFKDTRVQLGISWDRPLGDDMRYNIGFNGSAERDYVSAAVSAGIMKSFNNKNTQISVAGSLAFDTIEPEGEMPVPLSLLNQPSGGSVQQRTSSDDKQVVDLIFGLSQVINRRTNMQFNIGLSESDGYHNDAYKIVSIVDANGRPENYLYENRPDSRSKQFVYWQTQWFSYWQDSVTFSYRFTDDDWGVTSNTFDFRYRWNVNDKLYIQPRFRLYQQQAADFYRHSIQSSELTPEYVSADQRLAKFDATTLGVKVGYRLRNNEQVSFRIESYSQDGDKNPSDAIGIQNQYDLFSGVEAVIAQVSYSFLW